VKLQALVTLYATVVSLAATAASSSCENYDSGKTGVSVESQPVNTDALVRGWMASRPDGEQLKLVALTSRPGFLGAEVPCEPGMVSFDEAASVLQVSRHCHLGNGARVGYTYSFLVCELKAVPVALRQIDRQTVVSAESFQVVKREIPYAGIKRQLDLGRLHNYRAYQTIHEGSVLDDKNLELKPVVERKQLVTIRSAGAGFVLELPGVALTDGQLGDVVRVRSKVNGGVFRAKVESAGVVRVDG
jgi:flagella basal body P-ring formation protein FlgA